MARTHNHWDPALMQRLFITPPKPQDCRFATKRECDEFYRQYKRDEKERYELAEIERLRAKKELRLKVFDKFLKRA